MNPKTRKILDNFKAISAIPRCSGNEAAISHWLQHWAAEKGFASKSDPSGNLTITVAASEGYEKAPGIVFQGHMDMISLGPTIENPHSPDERLYIPSLEAVWTFLVALLKSYGQ